MTITVHTILYTSQACNGGGPLFVFIPEVVIIHLGIVNVSAV